MSALMTRWLHIVVVAVTAAMSGNFVEEEGVGERRKRRDGSKDPVGMGEVERHLG